MKYEFDVLEVETWDRRYTIEAETEEEARKKLFNGEFDDCDGETISAELKEVTLLRSE